VTSVLSVEAWKKKRSAPHCGAFLFQAHSGAAKRAMDAMMPMNKIDNAAIERAAAGSKSAA